MPLARLSLLPVPPDRDQGLRDADYLNHLNLRNIALGLLTDAWRRVCRMKALEEFILWFYYLKMTNSGSIEIYYLPSTVVRVPNYSDSQRVIERSSEINLL